MEPWSSYLCTIHQLCSHAYVVICINKLLNFIIYVITLLTDCFRDMFESLMKISLVKIRLIKYSYQEEQAINSKICTHSEFFITSLYKHIYKFIYTYLKTYINLIINLYIHYINFFRNTNF